MLQGKFLIKVVNGTICILALIIFIAGMYPSPSNWGVNHLAFYSSTMQFIIPMLMLLLLIPSVRCFLVKHLERIINYFGKQKKMLRCLYALLFLAASAGLFWVARTATHFLGDGYGCISILKDMEIEGYYLYLGNHEPLSVFSVFKLKQLLSALGSSNSAETAYRVYSIFFGILFMVVVWKLTGFISKERIDRVLVFLFLLASGTSQLFFGYVENYALAYCMIFLFILASVSYLQHKTSIIYPAIVFPVLVSSYFATIIFLPVLLSLMWVSIRRKEIKATVLASISALALTVGLMWILGYTYTYVVKVLEEERNPIVLFAGDSTFYQAYTFFSVGHAIDLLNLFFLLQPTALVLLFTSGWLKYKQENKTEGKIFLALIMACGITFVCLANCTLGMSRDWDALSVFCSGISVIAIYGWFNNIEESCTRRELFAAITVVALLQTGLWIGVNTNETSSFRRLDILQEDPRWSPSAKRDLTETRGKFYFKRKEYADAARCYERGVILEPSTSRFLSPLGRIYTLMGQDAKTIEIYKRMDSLGCADAQIYSKLGILYLKYRCCNDALMYLYKAEALDSSSALIPFHIGTAIAIRENSYEKGLPYFLKAIELDPLYAIAYYNASLCYRKMGDMVMAQNYYKRFDELSSSQPSGTRQDVSDPY